MGSGLGQAKCEPRGKRKHQNPFPTVLQRRASRYSVSFKDFLSSMGRSSYFVRVLPTGPVSSVRTVYHPGVVSDLLTVYSPTVRVLQPIEPFIDFKDDVQAGDGLP